MTNGETAPSITSSAPTLSRRVVAGLLLAAIVVVPIGGFGGFLFWHRYYGPCGLSRVQSASSTLYAILTDWDNANQLALVTSRIALAPQIETLQEIRGEVVSVAYPPCMTDAMIFLDQYMQASIDRLLLFLAEAHDGDQARMLLYSDEQLLAFQTEFERVLACAPNC